MELSIIWLNTFLSLQMWLHTQFLQTSWRVVLFFQMLPVRWSLHKNKNWSSIHLNGKIVSSAFKISHRMTHYDACIVINSSLICYVTFMGSSTAPSHIRPSGNGDFSSQLRETGNELISISTINYTYWAFIITVESFIPFNADVRPSLPLVTTE